MLFENFLACVMNLKVESKSFMAAIILQWVVVLLIVLSPDLSGELNSTTAGVVNLSLTNFISDGCLIMRFIMSLLYE